MTVMMKIALARSCPWYDYALGRDIHCSYEKPQTSRSQWRVNRLTVGGWDVPDKVGCPSFINQ